MPVATVNLMTTTQLNGLSTTAISALVNSPNYSSFSSVIQSNLNSLSIGSTAQLSSDSSKIKFSFVVLILNLVLLKKFFFNSDNLNKLLLVPIKISFHF